MQRLHFITFILPCFMLLSASAELSVTTVFNPPRIAMGDRAQYVVEIKETSDSKQPDVDRITSLPISHTGGLELSNGRTSSSQQTSIINGVAEYSVTQQLIIDAKPPRVGSFEIPTYTFQYKGQTLRAPAATLSVVERPTDAAPTTDELIFLKTDTPDQLYVGQTTPIQLKLYISEGVRLSALNSFDRSADAFTMSELPDSQESTEIYNGRRYRVLTWPLTITPIQTGEQDLNFQFTVSAQVPGQNNRRDPFGGRGLCSSIFDDFFGRNERFTVYTEPTQVEVLALPTKDQPPSFTGAIGDFAMEVYTDRQSTQVGEPIMLSIEIAGKGNFDRINGPSIPDSRNWRSYEPESNFQPRSPENALRGKKRFDYVIIANQAGTLEIPGLEFAYFEPEAKRYTRLNSPPIQIEVSPSNKPVTALTPSVPANDIRSIEALPLQKELSVEEALFTLDYQPKPTRQSGDPLHDSRFWMVNTGTALALAFLAYKLRRKRRLAEDRAFAEHVQAKNELKVATKAALQAVEAEVFYARAQSAMRLALTARTRLNLRTACVDQITATMQSEGLCAENIESTRTLYASADALRFAGTKPEADLSASKQALERILKSI